MARKIYGKIKNSNTGAGIKGLKVKAWDSDSMSGDDYMGSAITDSSGNYSISYRRGRWDPGSSTQRRPDIYIKVFKKSSVANSWIKVHKSNVHSNQKRKNDLKIDVNINIQAPINKMTTFDPIVHSFKFNNRNFSFNPSVHGLGFGSWKMGFCGGMCAAALYRYNKGIPIPSTTRAPREGTRLYNELLRRQVVSLTIPSLIIPKIYVWQSAPNSEDGFSLRESIGSKTKKEWRKLKKALDKGIPTNLILIQVKGYTANISRNHQVIAIGYIYDGFTKDLSIKVYDPNRKFTTQTLTMNLGLENNKLNANNSTGKVLRGFFINPNGAFASSFLF